MRITVPAFGTLYKAGAKAEGLDLEALSLSDIFALVGPPPPGIPVEKAVLEYSEDGSAIIELFCADAVWLAGAQAALESRTQGQLRSLVPKPFKKGKK